MQRVMIAPATYQDCLEAVRRALELFPLPVAGKKVLVKPNVLRMACPEEAITTHPAVLKAVVSCLKDMAPAELIVGDNPGVVSYGANEQSFAKAGLIEASQGHYRNIGQDAVEVDFTSPLKEKVSVSRVVLEADLIISLPKFKTHGLTVMTGAIKNSYGFLPGAQKALLHRLSGNPERFHETVVEVFRLRPPDLFIVDAVVGMQGNGPASTDLKWIGRILASDNAVALDAVIARLMGLEPARLRFLQKARELGLGDFEQDSIEVLGEATPLADFKVPPLGGEAIMTSQPMQELLHRRTLVRPVCDQARCTVCGTCVEQCPVGALSLDEGYAKADPELCIACFCCQEMCPEKAIALQ